MPIIDEILSERKRQDLRWGQQDHSPKFRLLILLEEIGEAARAVLEGQADDYKKELTQVAAVSIAALESLARGNMNLDSIVRLQREVNVLRKQQIKNRTRTSDQKETTCPFCGSEEKEIGSGPELTIDADAGTVVRCKNCGAYGPWADTIKEARELWEKRKSQPKS